MRTSPSGHHPSLTTALDQLLSSGGKRIRPALVLLSGAMLGGDADRLTTMAAAIELLHTATLVHDDLIDGSLLRRGAPTLNATWSPGATVLTGDYVFARAAFLTSQTGSLPLMESFARTLMTIVNGEITQLFRSPRADARREYFDRIYAKTASLFELATEGAALLSQSDAQTVQRLKTVGYHFGMAFQIADDVLDFTGVAGRVGKPVAHDLRQGLLTLPTLCFLDEQPDDPRLQEILDGEALDESAFDGLIDSIRRSGAIDRALEEARSQAAAGESLLSEMPDNPERRALSELAEFLVERNA